jgi:hypothetical protein
MRHPKIQTHLKGWPTRPATASDSVAGIEAKEGSQCISAWHYRGGTGRLGERRRPYVPGTAHKLNG